MPWFSWFYTPCSAPRSCNSFIVARWRRNNRLVTYSCVVRRGKERQRRCCLGAVDRNASRFFEREKPHVEITSSRARLLPRRLISRSKEENISIVYARIAFVRFLLARLRGPDTVWQRQFRRLCAHRIPWPGQIRDALTILETERMRNEQGIPFISQIMSSAPWPFLSSNAHALSPRRPYRLASRFCHGKRYLLSGTLNRIGFTPCVGTCVAGFQSTQSLARRNSNLILRASRTFEDESLLITTLRRTD